MKRVVPASLPVNHTLTFVRHRCGLVLMFAPFRNYPQTCIACGARRLGESDWRRVKIEDEPARLRDPGDPS